MLKNYLTLLMIGLIWGSQFIFQEIALIVFSPVWIGTFRALLGAITVSIICRIMGIKGHSKQWGLFAIIAMLEATLPFVLVPWGQKELSGSVAAILMGTLPFYALLLSPIFIKGSRITKGNLFSVVIGFIGLVELFYPDLSSETQHVNLLSALAVVLAAICFAIALLLVNKVKNEHPLIIARNVLIMASIQLVIIALVWVPLTFERSSLNSFLSLIYLGVMCAGGVYYLYMQSIQNAGAVFTSMTNYLVPAVGVLIGAMFGNEKIQMTTWFALGIILTALFINQLVAKKSH